MTIKPRERPADDEDDPVENMLKKSGCLELHYKVQVNTYILNYTTFFHGRKIKKDGRNIV